MACIQWNEVRKLQQDKLSRRCVLAAPEKVCKNSKPNAQCNFYGRSEDAAPTKPSNFAEERGRSTDCRPVLCLLAQLLTGWL